MSMTPDEANGGFPEPPGGDPVKIVSSDHAACGEQTRVRLSGYLPAGVVRRVVCQGCGRRYGAEGAAEVGAADPEPSPEPTPADPSPEASSRRSARSRPSLPKLPPASSRIWRWAGIPVAALFVVGALLLLQGDDEPSPNVVVGPSTPAAGGGERSGSGAPANEASFVTQPGFSLALPPGWQQAPAEGGAAFMAEATDGGADATLWIEQAPDLSFADFEARSLEALRSLTGNAEVVERIPAPTDAGTVVKLRADAPEGTGVSAPYEVTLRAAGPFRYYLATTVEPGASIQASEGADLIHGSFIPEPDGAGAIQTGAPPGGE